MNVVWYIYLVTNLVNRKRYVGCTKVSVQRRWAQHRSAAAKGSSLLIHRAIRKYGTENFSIEVIETVEGVHADLMAAEVRQIAACGCLVPYGYNLTPGGQGVDYSVPAIREKHLAAVRKSSSTQEWRTKNAEATRRLASTSEWREAQLEGVRKRSVSPEWRENITKANREKSTDPRWQEAHAEGVRRRNASPGWAVSVAVRTQTQVNSETFRKAAVGNAMKARAAYAAQIAAREAHLTPDERAKKARLRERWRKNAARKRAA